MATSLTLFALRCPDGAVPGSQDTTGADLVLGRGAECDWVLADPERILSKRHCVLECRGGWRVRDLSTNGTFVNFSAAPIGRDQVAPLAHGDRLRLGPWEFEVSLTEIGQASQDSYQGWSSPLPFASANSHPPQHRDVLYDPMAQPKAPRAAFGQTIPHDFDPFAPDGSAPDHRPVTMDAFTPPPLQKKPALLEDWDLDPEHPTPAELVPPAMLVTAPEIPRDPGEQSQEPSPHRRPAGMEGPPAPGPPRTQGASLAMFLEGAGLPVSSISVADQEAFMRGAGAMLRAAVAGLRVLLMARANVKREFRIEQTILRSTGNNSVKFAATDEAALSALLSCGDTKDIASIIADLSAHQVATLAATQAAANALLERLAPSAVTAPSGTSLLPGAREKRLWEAYCELHRRVTEQFEDDFDSAFGKSFARAYEIAVRNNNL
jgi:type VI secretion system FHA domain protein